MAWCQSPRLELLVYMRRENGSESQGIMLRLLGLQAWLTCDKVKNTKEWAFTKGKTPAGQLWISCPALTVPAVPALLNTLSWANMSHSRAVSPPLLSCNYSVCAQLLAAMTMQPLYVFFFFFASPIPQVISAHILRNYLCVRFKKLTCIEGRNGQAVAVNLNSHSLPFKVRWQAFDPDDTQQSNGAVLYAANATGGDCSNTWMCKKRLHV